MEAFSSGQDHRLVLCAHRAAAEVDIAAFADGHVNGYSVTAEVFPNMADATSIASAAWDRILTLGQGTVDEMEDVCAQIEAAQPAP